MKLKLLCISFILNVPLIFNLSAQVSQNDSVVFSIIYEFQQKAVSDGQSINLVDTMVLNIDNNTSNYYDLYLSRRDSIEDFSFRQMNSIKVSGDYDELERILELKNKADIILNDREYNKTKIFKDRNLHQIVTTHRGSSKNEQYKALEEIVHNWDISLTDTDTIFDYVCMKATTQFRGRTYFAWFTLNIPISEGPWKFYGLPGMILRIEDSEGIFKFNIIGLRKLKKENNRSQLKIREEIISNKQIQDYINNKQKLVSYGIQDGASITFYRLKNPIIFQEMEIEGK